MLDSAKIEFLFTGAQMAGAQMAKTPNDWMDWETTEKVFSNMLANPALTESGIHPHRVGNLLRTASRLSGTHGKTMISHMGAHTDKLSRQQLMVRLLLSNHGSPFTLLTFVDKNT